MYGQGRPQTAARSGAVPSHFLRRPATAFAAALSVSLWLAAAVFAVPEKNTGSTHNMQLRLTWGGGADQTWRVVVRGNAARLSEPKILGLGIDTPGSAYLDENCIYVSPQSPGNYGGIDFFVEGDSDSNLTLEIFPLDLPEQKTVRTIALESLRTEQIGAALDSQQNRFLLTRVAGDQLQIDINRPHLVFESGEAWNFEIRPNLTGNHSKALRLVGRLAASRSPNQVLKTVSADVTLDQWGSSSAVKWQLVLPEEEGIYELLIDLETRWYQANFSPSKAQRKIQFIVLGKGTPEAEKTEQWNRIAEIEQFNTRGESPFFGRGNIYDPLKLLSSGAPEPTNGEKSLTLDPGQWRAIPLRINDVDRPHLIKVEYDGQQTQAIGLSILQPDASGNLSNFGFNSGIVIGDEIQLAPMADSHSVEHQFLFWPNRMNPVLMVANRHEKNAITVRNIQVFSGTARLPDMLPQSPNLGENRSLMAFYELPLFSENFGGEKITDPVTHESLDDWTTFYQSADRLIQYLKYSGYRGAMVAMNGQGGTLFPSDHLQPNPRFDSGRFFSSGQDPVQKDVMEMMFRMFEREGLQLLPALSFSAPLPEVEKALRTATDKSIPLVDYRGQTIESHPNLPRYNAISPTVRTAVDHVVDEVTQRYQTHQNFVGLAVLCRGDTYSVLPGKRWGFDLATIQKFVNEQMPNIAPLTEETLPAFISQELLGSERQKWTTWRCEQLNKNYQKWQDTLTSKMPNAKLYLAGVDLFRTGDLHQTLSPSLHAPVNLDEALKDIGWDAGLWKTLENTIVLRPNRIAPAESLTEQRLELHLAQSQQIDGLFKNASYSADLFAHRDSWVHWQKLSDQIPGYANQDDVYRMQPLEIGTTFNQQRFAESLYRYDSRTMFDGGWTLSLGKDDRFRRFAWAFSQLPNLAFENVSALSARPLTRPVALRQSNGNEFVAYAVNSSPWKSTVTLQFQSNPNGVTLIPEDVQSSPSENDPLGMKFDIEPFGLVVLKGPRELRLTGYSATLPAEAGERLRGHLHQLQAKLTLAANAQPINVLENPEFEHKSPNLGWMYNVQQSPQIELVKEVEPENWSLKIKSDGPIAWARSNWFDAPTTGRLTIAVWLRTENPEEQPPLRVAIESDEQGIDYYRFGSIGSLASNDLEKQVDSTCKKFVVHFDDLPGHTQAKLRIGFDMMGPGNVFIDRVELYDRWFDENEIRAITQLLASAGPLLSDVETVDEGRFRLDGYWPRFVSQMFGSELEETSSDKNQESKLAPADALENSRQGFMFRRFRRSSKSNNSIR